MTTKSDFPETADIETSSDDYASRFSGATGAWMLSVQARVTLDLLLHAGVKTILDVGGGHGQLAQPLIDAGYEVTVLGSDESCRSRIKHHVDAEQMQFQIGNVVALPFEDKSFDAVVSFRLLPHCERWPELISEMGRVARTTVIGDYPTTQSLNAIAPLFFGAKKKMEGNTRTWRAFKHREIRCALRDCGYHMAEKRGQFFWPMVVHRMLKKPGVSRVLEGLPQIVGLRSCLGSPVVFRGERM